MCCSYVKGSLRTYYTPTYRYHDFGSRTLEVGEGKEVLPCDDMPVERGPVTFEAQPGRSA